MPCAETLQEKGYQPRARWSRATLPLLSSSMLPYLSTKSLHQPPASSCPSPLCLDDRDVRLLTDVRLSLDPPLGSLSDLLCDVSYDFEPPLSLPAIGVTSSAELSACCQTALSWSRGRDLGDVDMENCTLRERCGLDGREALGMLIWGFEASEAPGERGGEGEVWRGIIWVTKKLFFSIACDDSKWAPGQKRVSDCCLMPLNSSR